MTDQIIETAPPRRLGRSAVALLAAFVAVFVLSLGTDQLLHVLDVYPPWGEPMRDTDDNLLALAYRLVYGVVGGYITASLAPRAPMAHALILGTIGTVLSLLGAIAGIQMDMGPAWFPIALVATALPTAWLGAVLAQRSRN
jgi:hypothetical protein